MSPVNLVLATARLLPDLDLASTSSPLSCLVPCPCPLGPWGPKACTLASTVLIALRKASVSFLCPHRDSYGAKTARLPSTEPQNPPFSVANASETTMATRLSGTPPSAADLFKSCTLRSRKLALQPPRKLPTPAILGNPASSLSRYIHISRRFLSMIAMQSNCRALHAGAFVSFEIIVWDTHGVGSRDPCHGAEAGSKTESR